MFGFNTKFTSDFGRDSWTNIEKRAVIKKKKNIHFFRFAEENFQDEGNFQELEEDYMEQIKRLEEENFLHEKKVKALERKLDEEGDNNNGLKVSAIDLTVYIIYLCALSWYFA